MYFKSWPDCNYSSNNILPQVGDVVIYSLGSSLTKCVIRKITTKGISKPHIYRIHLECVDVNNGLMGKKYVAKDPIRLWILPETMDDVLKEVFKDENHIQIS